MSRCSFEKPSSLDRFLRTRSPSRIVIGRPPSSEQLREQHVGDRRFAGAAEAGEEHGEALPLAGRVAAAELLHHFGVREPGRNLGAAHQPVAELRAADVERLLVLRHFVDRVVFLFIRHEDHLLEVDHLHAQLFFVLLQQLLGIVRSVERLAARVLAGAGVIAADDQVRAAVVLADDRVPDRLARPAHPHRQRQQREVRRVLRDSGTSAPGSSARACSGRRRPASSCRRPDARAGWPLLPSPRAA